MNDTLRWLIAALCIALVAIEIATRATIRGMRAVGGVSDGRPDWAK